MNALRPRSRAHLLFWGGLLLAGFLTLGGLLYYFTGRVEEIGPIHVVAFCPDGVRFVTANQDGSIRLWETASGKEIRRYLKNDEGGAAIAVAVSPDGKHLVSARAGEDATVWDLENGKELRSLIGHTGWVRALTFTADGRRILSASSDRTVRVWDVDSGHELQCLKGHEADVNCVAVTRDGRFAVSGSGDYSGGIMHDPSVRVWDLAKGQALLKLEHPEAVDAITLSPDGKLAVTVCDEFIYLWDIVTGKEVRHWQGYANQHFSAVAFSPDGRFVLSGTGMFGGPMQLWDVSNGQEVRRFKKATAEAHSIAFSPDGRRVVSGHGYFGMRPARNIFIQGLMEGHVVDGVARLWDVETGQELLRVPNLPEDAP
jgi:WD40 repeat protein